MHTSHIKVLFLAAAEDMHVVNVKLKKVTRFFVIE